MDAKALPLRPSLDQYRTQAKDLLRQWRAGDPDATRRIDERSHVRRRSEAQAPGAGYVLADTQFVIAREHGFGSWPKFAAHIQGLGGGPVRCFESSADAIVAGDTATLEPLLRANRDLVRWRSTRAHRATLLHYVAANGVEDFRQKTPKNAVTVATLLLGGGAHVDSSADMYGGESTTMDMLVSSVHPSAAGLQVALVDTLLDSGAAINGIAGDGSPVLTALAFHYPDAAAALVHRGARIDNIIAAAGVGREDLVRSFVTTAGKLRDGVPLAAARWPRLPKVPRVHIEAALILASALGRHGVVDFLSDKGVDVRAKDNQGFTALHWASFRGHRQIIDVLLERGAPLESQTKCGATVLDCTVWASVHGRLSVDYVPVVQRLIDAGARTDAVRLFPSGNTRVDELLAHHGARAP